MCITNREVTNRFEIFGLNSVLEFDGVNDTLFVVIDKSKTVRGHK